MFSETVQFIKQLYGQQDFIPLHVPVFAGNEKKYLLDCIDSTFVSSVGPYVNRFEEDMAAYVGSRKAVVAVNGTAALHIALLLAGVDRDSEVITQPLTFIATSNAICYAGASAIYLDVDKETMGLSVTKLEAFLHEHTYLNDQGECINKKSKKVIRACVPMHTFGHVGNMIEMSRMCKEHGIFLIEDAAESIGSYYDGKHSGTFGDLGVFSFNGNKTITSGGGGVIVTDNEALAKRAKHLTTQAKVPHPWNFDHDSVGYNYRMPNINAALACAQLEQVDGFLRSKREIAGKYEEFFANTTMKFFKEPSKCHSNYWLNAVLMEAEEERDSFLEYSNAKGVMTRPVWKLMSELPMFRHFEQGDLSNARWLEKRLVNIPSSAIIHE